MFGRSVRLNHTIKSLLSFNVIVPSKSVKKIYFGFLKGQFIAFNSDVEAMLQATHGVNNSLLMRRTSTICAEAFAF